MSPVEKLFEGSHGEAEVIAQATRSLYDGRKTWWVIELHSYEKKRNLGLCRETQSIGRGPSDCNGRCRVIGEGDLEASQNRATIPRFGIRHYISAPSLELQPRLFIG